MTKYPGTDEEWAKSLTDDELRTSIFYGDDATYELLRRVRGSTVDDIAAEQVDGITRRLTNAEAQKAYDEAVPVPMSRERIQEIVDFALKGDNREMAFSADLYFDLGQPFFGQCRAVYANVQTQYAAQTYYQTPALVAVIPAIFVPSASYTVGVSAAAYTPATSTATVTTTKTDSIVANDVGLAMLAELKAMRAEARASNAEIKSMLGGKQPAPPAKMPVGPEALPEPKLTPKEKAAADAAIFVLKKGLAGTNVSCASCHNPTGKNGGLVAFSSYGEYTGMTDEQAVAMAKKVSAEKVCPRAPGALTGQDKATVLEALPPLPKPERPLQGMIRPRQTEVAKQ